jgi:putative DNA methylase
MPSHAHVVVWPVPGHTLSEILHSWKSFTAHEIGKRLTQKVVPFWQAESYDHLIRHEEDLQRCCHYTTMNPVNAGLCARPEDWRWSSAHAAPPPTVPQPSPAAGSGTVPVPVCSPQQAED